MRKCGIAAYCYQGSGWGDAEMRPEEGKTCTSHQGVWSHLNLGALKGFMQERDMIRLEI